MRRGTSGSDLCLSIAPLQPGRNMAGCKFSDDVIREGLSVFGLFMEDEEILTNSKTRGIFIVSDLNQQSP